ncbi:hypothetical protein CsSME_00053893 [Camellia sinensis var. sinensis]
MLASEVLGKRVRKYWLTGSKPTPTRKSEQNQEECIREFLGGGGHDKSGTGAIDSGSWFENRWEWNSVGGCVSFADQYFNTSITVVQEQSDALYVASRFADFVGMFKR